MIPEVGTTCAFTYLSKFATLDGIYRIRAETTFADAITSGIDFVKNLYTPAGLSQLDFNADYKSYLKDRVAILESVKDDTIVYYVPESIFLNIPDPTVKEYLSITLVVNLGVQENTQVIYPLIDQINDLMMANLGASNAVYLVANPQNKIYLTDNDYTLLEQARQANIDKLIPLSVQLKQEIEQKNYLAAKCIAYEALLANISTG